MKQCPFSDEQNKAVLDWAETLSEYQWNLGIPPNDNNRFFVLKTDIGLSATYSGAECQPNNWKTSVPARDSYIDIPIGNIIAYAEIGD